MYTFALSFSILILVIGVPIFLVLVIGAGIICVWGLQIPWFALAEVMFESCTKYILLAIPLFIFASNLMLEGGLARRLVDVFTSLVGHFRGGLAIAMVLGMGFFGAISGSILAAIVAIGGIMIPIMEEKGYSKSFAGALAASAAGLDALIPPSNGAIIFSAITGEPVSRTFAAGIIPGLFQMCLLIAASMVMARHMNLIPSPKFSWRERWRSLYRATSALIMPIIILGGIYSGTFSPMESAAVACIWAFIAGMFIHKQLNIAGIGRALKRSTEVTAIIFAIIAAASFLSVILSYTRLPQNITAWCLSRGVTPISFLLMGALACLVLGTFIEVVPVMYLTVPIMASVAAELGIPLVQLYIATGAFIGAGLITPPVCVGAYTAAATAVVKPQEVLKFLFPVFFLILMFCGLTYIYIPWFSAWLPNVIG